MRRHVDDLSTGIGFPISFITDGEEREASVGPVFRREVFLVFKEALNNVLRHSGCTKCSVSLMLRSGWLTLRIEDNGKGFDPDTSANGNGLDSMRRRGKRLGGALRIETVRSQGTVIELHVPASRIKGRE